MIFVSTSKELSKLRHDFPKGTRVVLDKMDDPYTILTPGAKGTVDHVDDAGNIHVRWDNGSGLNLIPGEDDFHKEVDT